MATKKKNVDAGASDPKQKQDGIVATGNKGHYCDEVVEGFPCYIQAPCETALTGKNNSQIILGRDRMGTLEHGYGGAGHTQCGTIDLVVGRGGPHSHKGWTKKGERIYINPEPVLDAARIYISQKTDIDNNFALEGTPGSPKMRTRSAIGMKADEIRIMARGSIRIVTGCDKHISQTTEGKKSIYGIDLCAGNGNGDDMEPLVKGHKLKKCLEDLMGHCRDIIDFSVQILDLNIKLLEKLGNHTHQVPLGIMGASLTAMPSPPLVQHAPSAALKSFKIMANNCVNSSYNEGSFRATYLNVKNVDYILSKHNNTN